MVRGAYSVKDPIGGACAWRGYMVREDSMAKDKHVVVVKEPVET